MPNQSTLSIKLSAAANILSLIVVVACVVKFSVYMDSTTENRKIWMEDENAARMHRCQLNQVLNMKDLEADRCDGGF